MLNEQIQKDLESAMKDKQELKVSTLRLLVSEIRNKQIEKQAEPNNEEIIALIRRAVKQRQESIESYQKGERNDLAEKEKSEMAILSNYLPQELSASEVEKVVKEVIGEVGVSGPQDFGKVMNGAMNRLKGKVDGAKVAEAVKKLI
jgi:hypothetical protein